VLRDYVEYGHYNSWMIGLSCIVRKYRVAQKWIIIVLVKRIPITLQSGSTICLKHGGIFTGWLFGQFSA